MSEPTSETVVVSDPGRLRNFTAADFPVFWDATGPTGPTGETGATGETGPSGPSGPTGPDWGTLGVAATGADSYTANVPFENTLTVTRGGEPLDQGYYNMTFSGAPASLQTGVLTLELQDAEGNWVPATLRNASSGRVQIDIGPMTIAPGDTVVPHRLTTLLNPGSPPIVCTYSAGVWGAPEGAPYVTTDFTVPAAA